MDNEIKNMKRCPDCGKEFIIPRKEGEHCDPEDMECESYVVNRGSNRYKELEWTNPNWDYDFNGDE